MWNTSLSIFTTMTTPTFSNGGDNNQDVKTSMTKIAPPPEDPISSQDLTDATCFVSDILIPHGTKSESIPK